MTPEQIVQRVLQQSEEMSRPVYRGQAAADWRLESGAVRRLRAAYGEDLPEDDDGLRALVMQYHRDNLIMPMQVIDGITLTVVQRLSVLQHQGAATGLLDFTGDLLIGLWFACEDKPDNDGKVFVLDIGDHQVAQNGRRLDDPFDAGDTTVYYEPDQSLGARIIAQKSVFLICNPHISLSNVKSVVIPQKLKEPLLVYLTRLGLSSAGLFGDIPGLAAENAVHKPLRRPTEAPSPEQRRDRGNRAYQAGQFEAALSEYELFLLALPEVAQPYCLVGDTLAALGRFKEANAAYTKAIENLDRPIYAGPNVHVHREPVATMMSQTLYFNRGNVRAAADDHLDAIADFDAALELGYEPKRQVLYNRGNSKYSLENFQGAHDDFEAVWLEWPDSRAALALGNCKVMKGDFAEGHYVYASGGAKEPENSAVQCRENAAQVQQLLEVLNGNDYQLKPEGKFLYVESEGLEGFFPIVGNSGNTGNRPSGMVTAPGGKGFKGKVGFVVIVRSPAP